MSDNHKTKVVWLYEKSHLRQPFICIALESLAEADCLISMIDTSNEPSGRKGYKHHALMRHCLSSLYIRRIMGKYSLSKVWWILPSLLFHTIYERPAVIVATMPAGLTLGWLASRLLKARLVYYPMELYGEQKSSFSVFWKRMEERILRRGIDALVTQNEERARIYTEERGARVIPTIVHNYKRKSDVSRAGKLRKVLGVSEGTQIVLYEGLFRPGRCLEKLIQAAAYLPQETRLVLMGDIGREQAWWRQNVETLLMQSDLGSKVLLAPWVEQDELLSYVVDADAGIIVYDDKVRNNYYCEPGKLSDYVLAGVPVVVPDFPTIGAVVNRYEIGAVFERVEPKEIAQAITRVLSVSKESWQPVLERAREDLVWETQLPAFLGAVSGQ